MWPRSSCAAPWSGTLTLPRPGIGATPARWSGLADLGRRDLARWPGSPRAHLTRWRSWPRPVPPRGPARPTACGRPGSGGTGAELDGSRLRGTVRFCSGAHLLDRALVVAAGPGGSRVIDVAIDRAASGPVPRTWRRRGCGTATRVDVELDDVPVAEARPGRAARLVHRPARLLVGRRRGGRGLARRRARGARRVAHRAGSQPGPDAARLAHLGALHAELAAADALLARPRPRSTPIPPTRTGRRCGPCASAAERTCRDVLEVAPRAAGVAALTRVAARPAARRPAASTSASTTASGTSRRWARRSWASRPGRRSPVTAR